MQKKHKEQHQWSTRFTEVKGYYIRICKKCGCRKREATAKNLFSKSRVNLDWSSTEPICKPIKIKE